MISVVIPTMWMYRPFLQFLPQLVDVSCIDEIIIINNFKNNTPSHPILEHNKIRMHNSDTNLFVSPSWNLGAKLAKHDVVCFVQDDIEFDTRVFDKAEAFIRNTTNIGIVGALVSYNKEASYTDVYDRFFIDGSINFISAKEKDDNKRPPATGIGNLFFIKKEDWIDIPEKIKIFHGEVLLWNKINETKDNHIIVNFRIQTPWHSTWSNLSTQQSREFSQIQQTDQEECEKVNFIIQ